jgi:hypothetical protein
MPLLFPYQRAPVPKANHLMPRPLCQALSHLVFNRPVLEASASKAITPPQEAAPSSAEAPAPIPLEARPPPGPRPPPRRSHSIDVPRPPTHRRGGGGGSRASFTSVDSHQFHHHARRLSAPAASAAGTGNGAAEGGGVEGATSAAEGGGNIEARIADFLFPRLELKVRQLLGRMAALDDKGFSLISLWCSWQEREDWDRAGDSDAGTEFYLDLIRFAYDDVDAGLEPIPYPL